jgi:alpha-L-fucosidase
VECVSKGGNLILNVGPTIKGEFPEEAVTILKEVGAWMKENGKSIYGCTFSDYAKPEWGRFTQNGNKLYAHVLEEQVGAICLPKMAGKVKSMRLIKDGTEVKESFYWNLKEYSENAYFFFDCHASDCYPLPDEKDTVVEITLNEK